MNTARNGTQNNFENRFGKKISEYDSIKNVVELLKPTTKDNYYIDLAPYFLFLNQNPDEVIQQRRKDINRDDEQAEYYDKKTTLYLKTLLEKGYAGRSILGYSGRIQGFFSNTSKRYSLDLKLIRVPKTRKNQKYSPSNEEVRRIIQTADSARDRLLVCLMYHFGLDPVDIANLELDDLPGQPWTYFEKSRSKTGETWRAVTTPDVCRELASYLFVRNIEASETRRLFLGRKTTVTDGVSDGYKRPINSEDISVIIRGLMDKAGLGSIKGCKPTSLRDAFEDSLCEANVNGKIKECLMGHSNNIEHEYGGENRIRIMCTEAMKKAYPLLSLGSVIIESNSDLKVEIEKIRVEQAMLKESALKIRDELSKMVEMRFLNEAILRINDVLAEMQVEILRIKDKMKP
jgi:integrase